MPTVDALLPLLPALEPLAVVAMLAVARTTGLMLALPHAAAPEVPRRVKALVILSLSLAMVGLGEPIGLASAHPLAIVVAMITELVLGLALGFVVQIVLACARIAGEIIGIEIGLSFSAIADPSSPGTSTATSAVLGHLTVQLLFALQLDRAFVVGLAHSVRRVPYGTASLRGATVAELSDAVGATFLAALQLAMPVLATVLAVKLALAVLARFVPRLQIFSLAFAITLVVGLNAFWAALGGLGTAIGGYLRDALVRMDRVLETFAPL